MSDWKPLRSGTELKGRYVVESLIGQGGFGATYAASDNGRFGEACVLKEMVPKSGSAEKAFERFEREAMALVELDHPGIPNLYEFFEEDGRCFLVQDFVDGPTLAEWVHSSGPLSAVEVRDVLEQLLPILEYLHNRVPPVVHRDVTPSNVIRGSDGRLRLIDFGAVKEAIEDPTGDPHSSVWTSGYAPVDQFMGKATPWCDLFATGATALHLLTGRQPRDLFDANAGRFRIPDTVPGDLKQLIDRLTVRADEAPVTAEGATRMLATTRSHSETPVPPTRVGSPEEFTRGGQASVSPPPPATRQKKGRRVLLWGGLAVGVAAVTGIWMSQGETSSTPTDDQTAAAEPTDEASVDPAGIPGDAPPTLDAVARAQTSSGLTVEALYPSAWRVTTTQADQHIAIAQPTSGSVFLVGLDAVDGTSVSPGAFVDSWRSSLAPRYGTITRVVEGVPTGDALPFRLEWVLPDGTQASGTMLVTPFVQPDGRATLFRWWATLGNAPETTPTLMAMAQSVEVVDPGGGL